LSLKEVPDDQLIDEAKKAESTGRLDAWETLCKNDPLRALRGLEAHAKAGKWDAWAWRPFLWAGQTRQDAESAASVARLLLDMPEEGLLEISSAAVSWLNENVEMIDDSLLLPLWDSIAEASMLGPTATPSNDIFSDALNSPAGRLAEVLLKKLVRCQGSEELPVGIQERFNKLIGAPDRFGLLARVRLAAEASILFEREPLWTTEKIIPLFDWSSYDAPAVWAARKYSNNIGSPQLFELTKAAFLDLFGRTDVPDEDIKIFAEWIVVIMLTNQSGNLQYPLTAVEARSALRRAGAKVLWIVAHRLAFEMEQAPPEQKFVKWKSIVGPVFESVWPLDEELQISATAFKLVQILCASGDAFRDAVNVILPFVRSGDTNFSTNVYSIAEADDLVYASSPRRVLDLLFVLVGDSAAGRVYNLGKALDRIRTHDPQLANTRKFQKLLSLAG